MKKTLTLVAVATALAAAALPADAANRKVMLQIAPALANAEADARLDDDIKMYFGTQKTPKVLEKLGSDKTSQKTNAFGKSDERACSWAFLSAMKQLQKRAKALGANAVVNIVSNYNNQEFSSETEFECHAGAIMAGAAFKADFVKIEKK